MSVVKFNYLEVVKDVINNMDLKGKACLDATSGRGNDGLMLLNKGIKFLYACDIQKDAIKSTDNLLKANGYNNFKTLSVSHSEVFDYIEEELEVIIYNLGYLPKSDKKIVTKSSSTIKSIERAIFKISKTGVIIIVSYLGHRGSIKERRELEKYLKNLDQKNFKVEKREFFNQINNPPIVYLVGVR